MVRTIIWDWNGTLLDDVDCCVSTLQSLCTRRQLRLLDRDEYRRRFGFPVRSFYEEIGFDFVAEEFSALSRDFIAEYRVRAPEVRVAAGAREILQRLQLGGVQHLVVSAMEHGLLGEMLEAYELRPLLTGHHGRPDHSAGSKVELGADVVRRLGLDSGELLVVGDTTHDLELARAIGCPAVLYTGGHQSRERLQASGAPLIDDLAELGQFAGLETHLVPGSIAIHRGAAISHGPERS